MSTTSISIVVPVYNEKPNIEPTSKAIVEAFGELSSDIEVLFVDANSPDGTAAEVERVSGFVPQVRLIQHGKKEGIGAAHRKGYESAKGEYIMCIDADLCQPCSAMLEMKDRLDNGYDLVVGSRYMPGASQTGKPLIRLLGSKGMNFICRYFLGIALTDCTHTFRAFRKKVFEDLVVKLDQTGHPDFQVQFSFWILKNNYRTTEIPINFVERAADRGQSKLSVMQEVPSFLRLVCRLMYYRVFS